jgi:hypothetical protein
MRANIDGIVVAKPQKRPQYDMRMREQAPNQQRLLPVINRYRRIEVDLPSALAQIFHDFRYVDEACLTAMGNIEGEIAKSPRTRVR